MKEAACICMNEWINACNTFGCAHERKPVDLVTKLAAIHDPESQSGFATLTSRLRDSPNNPPSTNSLTEHHVLPV